MNTKIIVAIIALVVLLGGGYLIYGKSKTAPQTLKANPQPTQKVQGNIFNSIQDALSRSLSLQCSFTDEAGRQITSYIKNGAVRADFTAQDPKQSGSVIIKNNTVYFWNGKQGFMMAMPVYPTGTAQNSQNGTSNSNSQGQNMIATMEKYKNSCKPAVVADTLFTQPSDVTFQDMSKIMQPQTTLPTGMAVPSSYQQYMHQYQQNSQQTPKGY